jgi:hypothetical protein
MTEKKKTDLTPKQVKALAVLSLGQTQAAAAKEAGVTQNTLTLWMKDEEFRDELRLLMERMRNQFESRVMLAANDGMAVIQQAMRSEDPEMAFKAANSSVAAGVRLVSRYKQLQVEGYVPPPAPMIVIPEGAHHPIFNPAQLPDVIDVTPKETDGDDADDTGDSDS